MGIRVAVIGAGVMGADHARIIAEDIHGATLQVVCDASAKRARAIADENGAADAMTDAPATIARSDVDAVLIASPDHTHAPLSIAAIEAGKPVLCEKPLAPSAAECLPVLEAEAKAGRRLVTTGYMRRFDPPYAAMKEALDHFRIGRAVMMHNIHRNVSAPPHFTGAMAITNSAPHEFDIIRFVLGAEITSVRAFQPAAADAQRVGAPVFLVLETSTGQIADVEVSVNANYGYDVRAELVGETGTVSLASPVHARLNADLSKSEPYPADWRPRFADAYRRQNKAWIRAIEAGSHAPEAASAWDGYVASTVAEAGVAALASGEAVRVNLAPRPAIYA